MTRYEIIPRNTTATAARRRTEYACDNPKCGRRLYRDGTTGSGRWITGQDRRITNGRRLPRYCWPGEGCNR